MWYAAQGWPVFPLSPHAKTPITPRGFLHASTRVDAIEAWWDAHPEANIGLRTGVAFDVLDLDGTEGLDSLRRLAPGYQHPGPIGATGKGFHLLFGVTGGRNFANSIKRVGEQPEYPGIDFRGQGGYIVAPPSIHPLGHRYAWRSAPDLEIPDPTDWLLALTRPVVRNDKPRDPFVQKAGELLDLLAEFASLGVTFQRKGNRLVGQCPFHQDDTPSLNVYHDQDFYCFGCNAWGDALNVRHFKRTGRLR